MAKPGFYNDNKNRAFPFKKGTVGLPAPTSGAITMSQLLSDAVVDCGFIMGPESGFEAEQHHVYLSEINRVGNLFYFKFLTTAPRVVDVPLLFVADMTEADYGREFVDSDIPVYVPASQSASASLSFSMPDPAECGEPFWSGYCVFGNLEALAVRLNTGEVIIGDETAAVVEPGLIQNLNNSQVVSVNIANGDRTRAITPAGCPDHRWAFNVLDVYVQAECIQGDLIVRPGHNVSLSQNAGSSTINIAPVVSAGLGQVCEELKLFDTETPPIGSTNGLLDGDYLCSETLRSVNGLQGPNLTFFAGTGVAITSGDNPHELVIDVNLTDLSICDIISVSESL